MKNAAPDWVMNFLPTTPKLSCGWRPIPNAFRLTNYRGFRRVLTHRFPYKIFFRIVGRDIIVFRILHGAQDHPRELHR